MIAIDYYSQTWKDVELGSLCTGPLTLDVLDEAKRLSAGVPCVGTFRPLGRRVPAQGELAGGGVGEGEGAAQHSWQCVLQLETVSKAEGCGL